MLTEDDKKEIEQKKKELFEHYLNHLNKQKGENKMEKVRNAIPVMKVNNKARANLVKAMAYDELVRQQSIERSTAYVSHNDSKLNRVPDWMWMLMWFILGVLGIISLDVSVFNGWL